MLTKDQKKIFFSACIGTILEWYDFSLYAYLAGVFAQIFFHAIPSIGLLLSYSVFAMGYLDPVDTDEKMNEEFKKALGASN